MMKLEVTRDVISDLWPLCRSRDASADSQGLVEQFLAQDSSFASALREGDSIRHVVPSVRLSPDAELRLLLDAQKRARIKLVILGGGIALAAILLFAAFAGALLLFARRGF